MAKKAKQQEKDRRARVEEMRREQQARERKRSILIIVVAVAVGLTLVGAATVPTILANRNDPAKKALSEFGVSVSAASCDDVTTDKSTGSAQHEPEGTKIEYDQVPPSSGPHWGTPELAPRPFYTAEDRPEMERLVHNLEHGYSIIWYDDTVKGEELDALKDIGESAQAKPAAQPGNKFVVSAWDDAYGKFPEGKHIALSHWGAESSHRQLCGKVSGAVVDDFMKQFPRTDAPEPNGQ